MYNKKLKTLTSVPEISIIVSCYNETNILENNIKRIRRVMNNENYEIILIDDKSKDSTAKIVKKISKEYKNIRCYFHDKNKGRGKTVSEGINYAKGSIVGFIDIDLEVNEKYILKVISEIRKGMDIATGKRSYKIGLKNIVRQVLHELYIRISRLMLNIDLKDSETGLKFFNKKKILPILKKTKNPHWFWDTEIMTRAYYHNLKIKEVSVIFIQNKKKISTVKPIKDSVYYIRKLIKFRKELKIEGLI